MDNKVIITADSTCDLSDDLKKRYGIQTLPLHINYDTNGFFDNVDITPDRIYDIYSATKSLPKTAAISVGEYKDFFKPYLDKGYSIVHFNLGSDLSCCYQNCMLLSQDMPGIYPVDTCNLSTGSGLLVLEAAELAQKGVSAEEIARVVKDMVPNSHASFILDKLEYMHAGGRCSAIVALGANLLNLKPCIEVDNTDHGKMGVGKKYRGKYERVLLDYVDDTLARYSNIKTDRIFITHAGISKEIEQIVYNHLADLHMFKDIYITTASCTVSSHCGPNTLGILFMTHNA